MNIKECHVKFYQSQHRIFYIHLCKNTKTVYLLNKLFQLYTKFWLVKLQSLIAKFDRKIYSPAKFANFVYIRITRKSFNNLFVKRWSFPRRSTKIYEICKHPSPPKVAPYLLFSGQNTSKLVKKYSASPCIFNSSRCLKIGQRPPPTRVWTITLKAFLQTKCWACGITGLNDFLFVNHIVGKIYLYIIPYEGKLWLHIVSKKW